MHDKLNGFFKDYKKVLNEMDTLRARTVIATIHKESQCILKFIYRVKMYIAISGHFMFCSVKMIYLSIDYIIHGT